MTIKLETGSPGVGLREGYGDLINPAPFVNPYNSSIRAGQQLQNLGGQLGDLAVAEQNVYNSTQVDLLNIERKTKMNAFLNNTRNGGNPQYLEQDYGTAFKQINKDVIKKSPNDRIKALVSAEGDNFFATKFPSIQKEARVYRLNGLKTGIQENIMALRSAMINTDDPLLKQDNAESINKLLSNAVDGGIMLPSEASDELLKISKDQEAAFIRRKMNAANTMDDFNEALKTTLFMKEETKEMRRDQFRTRLRERRSLKLREEELVFKQGNRARNERHRVGDASIRDRANDPDPLKRPDNDELDRLLGEDKITTAAYKDVKKEILNPPTAEPETNWDTYEDINKFIHHNDGPQITASEIGQRNDLAGAQKTTLLAQLQAVEHGTVNSGVTEGWKIIAKTVGTPEALSKGGKMALSKEVKVLNREFIDRYQKGEDPIDVANDISNRWLEADDVTSRTSQNRTARRLIDIPEKYRMSKDVNGLRIPDTFGMKQKINSAYDDSTLSSQDYTDLIDEVNNIKETWSIEKQELHGGTKKADTIAAEVKKRAEEVALKKQQDDEAAAQKAEEERRIQLEEELKQAEIQHQKEMEAREVVEQQEIEAITGKKQQAKADQQMRQSLSQVEEIAKSFNIDPNKLVELIEPLFQEMGGLEAINQFLGQAEEERMTEQTKKQTVLQEQDEKRVASLTKKEKQSSGQVKEEVSRLKKIGSDKDRLIQGSSEAKVLAKRQKEKQAADKRKTDKAKQLAEQVKTGLEDKKKYPDKRLLERLSDLQFRNMDKKLSSIETKEMETIEKEIKNRKLAPLPLG
tara:strand:+ start:4190 stop:6601 length:2412 start_codon:yes stop_codon:yes gene_type:complete